MSRVVALGPDEAIYLSQARCVKEGGLSAIRDIADEYLEEPTLSAYPSPIRWLWAALVSLFLPVSDIALQIVSAALVGPVVWWFSRSAVAAIWAATTPLVISLARRRLQDVPVAIVTLLAIGCALTHRPIGLAVSLFVVLSMKEGAAFSIPGIALGWLLSGGEPVALVNATSAACAAWALCLAVIFGRRLTAMMKALSKAHASEYGIAHQRGAPHRLLVDLVMVSPAAVVYAVLGAAHNQALAAAIAAILAAYAIAPIRNVRFVLAADVLLRVLGASAMSHVFIELPVAIAIDLLVWRRIRDVYDPVTQALATALGMQPAVNHK